MMIGRILLAASILTLMSPAHAGWDVGGGVEGYQWLERPDNGGTPKESGGRTALFANWTQDAERGVLFAWRAKLYGGTVNYDTYVISTGAPVSTKTEYSGAVSEVQGFYRYEVDSYKLDQIAGLGLDAWRRRIRNSAGDQIEDYSILFVRAGLRLTKSRLQPGFHGELGLKYPLSTRENAHLDRSGFTSNPLLSPKGALSGYGEFGYRINARFDVIGYYDSWRLRRSDDVIATDTAGATWSIYQPKSDMDALGVKLHVSF